MSVEQELAQDVAEYLELDEPWYATRVCFEGYSVDWAYSEYTAGSDHYIRAEVKWAGRPASEATGWHERRPRWHTEDRFDMAAFLRWVYEKG